MNDEASEAIADLIEQDWRNDRTRQDLAAALAADKPDVPDWTAWTITNDHEAGWALRKLAAARTELDRIDTAADTEIARIKAWAEDAKRSPEQTASFMEGKLIGYRRRLEDTDPKLAGTYKLPAGSIARRAGRMSIKVTDEAAFVGWALDNDPTALAYKPRVSELTGYGREDDGTLVDSETGERVPGVLSVKGDDTYKVTPNIEIDPF